MLFERLPHHKIARSMIWNVARLAPETLVRCALQRLRETDVDPRALLQLYVVDEEGYLTGIVGLGRLLTADPETRIGNLAFPAPVSLAPGTTVPVAVHGMVRYRLPALSVLDWEGRLLGAVTLRGITHQRGGTGVTTVRGSERAPGQSRLVMWFRSPSSRGFPRAISRSRKAPCGGASGHHYSDPGRLVRRGAGVDRADLVS